MLEKIRQSQTTNQLKSIILGCTHYPYLSKEIHNTLNELYHYKNQDGGYRYRDYMVEDIILVDPAVNTAMELYEYLDQESLFNEFGNLKDSEFYISVPNTLNEQISVDDKGRFPYDYKYGRKAGEIQEYVKVVPFSRANISEDILIRFKEQIPFVFDLIHHFNRENDKLNFLDTSDKI